MTESKNEKLDLNFTRGDESFSIINEIMKKIEILPHKSLDEMFTEVTEMCIEGKTIKDKSIKKVHLRSIIWLLEGYLASKER